MNVCTSINTNIRKNDRKAKNEARQLKKEKMENDRKAKIEAKQLKKERGNNNNITIDSIQVFEGINSRTNNDINNKIREYIVVCVINNEIPDEYYKQSLKWFELKTNIYSYIDKLCENNNINNNNMSNVKCIYKAGRGSHYDFIIKINDEEFKVEFKFNVSRLIDTPQFISPMNPSRYIKTAMSYEEFYYYDYLFKLCRDYNLNMPNIQDYLKQIHSPNPKCMEVQQNTYYAGCSKSSKYTGDINSINFYKSSLKLSKDSIFEYISKNELDINKLSTYLIETQKNKCYMLYKNDKIYYESVNLDNYIITDVSKEPMYNRFIANTKKGNKLKILLRWKNGNGIAYPAFQIS